MHKGSIIFNGKNSKDLGIIVEEVPNLSRPQRKFAEYSVPGRSGTIIEQYDAYENIDKSYNIWFTDYFYKNLYSPVKAREIAEWLYTSNGYMTLEDDFEPEYFRLAYFNGPLDIANLMQKYGKATINFNCRPERYLKSGEKWLNDPSVIKNPFAFSAKPLIKVEGQGNITVTIQGQTFVLTDITDYVYIDCETMDCYRQETENMNSHFSGDFPVLKPGDNSISITTSSNNNSFGNSNIKIKPRFWTI